jgi:hypothetical protein
MDYFYCQHRSSPVVSSPVGSKGVSENRFHSIFDEIIVFNRGKCRMLECHPLIILDGVANDGVEYSNVNTNSQGTVDDGVSFNAGEG